MEIDKLGEYLEHNGFNDSEIDVVLSHYGVPGQKWGVRRSEKKLARSKMSKDDKTLANHKTRVSRRAGTVGTFLAGNVAINTTLLAVGTVTMPVLAAATGAQIAGTIAVNKILRNRGQNKYNEVAATKP